MEGLRIIFICQSVDQNDPINAGTIRWIKALAEHPKVEKVDVIALHKGIFSLPHNVAVHSIKKGGRLSTLLSFYKVTIAKFRQGVDFFFIYQGGPYPILLLPFRWLGKPIFQWKAHPNISYLMHFYAKFCDTLLFASTPSAFPLQLPNVRYVGQGIDVEFFKPELSANKRGDLITVGRISPIKGIEHMIFLIYTCHAKFKKSYSLHIYGPISNVNYKNELDNLIKRLDIKNLVKFHGPVKNSDLPKVLNQYKAFLSFSGTALDRAVVEAMACGLPVFSTNPCFEEILPTDLKDLLVLPSNDVEIQCKKLINLFSMPENLFTSIQHRLREEVVKHHNITHLIEKIIEEIEKWISK